MFFDLGLVEVGELVFLDLGVEAELVHMVDDLAQVVAALDAVLNLGEDLAGLVFDGAGAGGALLEAGEAGEEPGVDEGGGVVSAEGGVVVDPAILGAGGGPAFPAVGLFEDEGVFAAVEGGLGGLVGLEGVELFEEKNPGRLHGVIQLAGATGVLPEDVVDVLKSLFKHGGKRGSREERRAGGKRRLWGGQAAGATLGSERKAGDEIQTGEERPEAFFGGNRHSGPP